MFGIELASGRDDVVPLGTLVHHSGNAESSSVLETEIHVPPRDLLHATALAVGSHIKLTEVTAALANRTFGSSFGALVVRRSFSVGTANQHVGFAWTTPCVQLL